MNPFQTTKGKYFDNYAGSQQPVGFTQGLSTPHYTGHSVQGSFGQKLATVKQPATELDRLRKERRELVETGCYDEDDHLI